MPLYREWILLYSSSKMSFLSNDSKGETFDLLFSFNLDLGCSFFILSCTYAPIELLFLALFQIKWPFCSRLFAKSETTRSSKTLLVHTTGKGISVLRRVSPLLSIQLGRRVNALTDRQIFHFLFFFL